MIPPSTPSSATSHPPAGKQAGKQAGSSGAPIAYEAAAVPRAKVRWSVKDYAWWVGKNILGWLLILISPVLGAALPGPGGIPIFLIGFAMVSFPGKRHGTARVFRGIPISLSSNVAGVVSGLGACLLPLVAAIVMRIKFEELLTHRIFHSWSILGIVVGMMAVSFVLMRLGLRLLNVGIRLMPYVRRKARPWMRHKGIDLLPPRRRRRLRQLQPGAVDHEILELHPRHGERAVKWWKILRPWLIGGAVAVVAAIVVRVIW